MSPRQVRYYHPEFRSFLLLIGIAAGCIYYHLARILSLECLLLPVVASQAQRDTYLNNLRKHSLSIASICLSPGIAEGVLVVAVNPLFYGLSFVRSYRYDANSLKLQNMLDPD